MRFTTFHPSFILFALLVFTLFIAPSCKTIEKSVKKPAKEEVKTDREKVREQDEAARFLAEHRNQLSDVYANQRHNYPSLFNKKLKTDEESQIEKYRGYRIQLISTRNVSIADSTQAKYRRWVHKYPLSLKPQSYIQFRQPYYRVHVGDFQYREQAIQFSRLLKKKFPDAWVVHDRINPNRVPADTIEISIKEKALKADTLNTTADSLFIEEK